MIITEQLALQTGYKYRFHYSALTVYFKTYVGMLIEHILLPDNTNVQMQEYIDGTWIDL